MNITVPTLKTVITYHNTSTGKTDKVATDYLDVEDLYNYQIERVVEDKCPQYDLTDFQFIIRGNALEGYQLQVKPEKNPKPHSIFETIDVTLTPALCISGQYFELNKLQNVFEDYDMEED